MNRIEPIDYHGVVTKLRSFFEQMGFIEVPAQSRLSILAACEDPSTLASFRYDNNIWPLPQTGQMWLEYELLNNPDSSGFYCITTSYRQEKDPIPGRHETIFPMFEFELPGMNLFILERELLEYLGFGGPPTTGAKYGYVTKYYMDAANEYDVRELTAEHEERLCKDYGDVVFLEGFPQYTSPFWNMEREGSISNKIDVILYGMETIGSAQRSCDPEQMRESFHTISDGKYAQMLYDIFGEDRVEAELEEFLGLDFFPRCGGGIGLTRLIRAMKLEKGRKNS